MKANGMTRLAATPVDAVRTLGDLHLRAERSGARRSVFRVRVEGRWQETPGWRFYRQVIRIALFLRERLHVKAGDKVLFSSALRPERAVAEWATVSLGAVAIGVSAEPTAEALAAIGGPVAPKVAFVGRAQNGASSVTASGLAGAATVLFDAARAEGDARSWVEVLDLGGTLDTAERAQSFRAQAAEWTADMPALGYVDAGSTGVLTHGEVVERVRSFWARVPSGEADVAYLAADAERRTARPCLPLWAFVADGKTSTVFGSPGGDTTEVAELAPHLLVVPPDSVERFVRLGERSTPRGVDRAVSRLLARVPRARALLERVIPGRDTPRDRLRQVLTFDGTRVGQETGRFQ